MSSRWLQIATIGWLGFLIGALTLGGDAGKDMATLSSSFIVLLSFNAAHYKNRNGNGVHP